MSLILDGTNGLSDVDGSAATPAIRGTDTNTGIFFPAADTIAFSEGGAESMRLNSAGNVGIGATDPVAKLDVRGILAISNAAASYWGLDRNDSDGALTFADGTTERMRIDTAGKVCIGINGAQQSAMLSVTSGANNTSIALKGDSGTNCGSIRYLSATTGNNRWQAASNENNYFIFDADASNYAFLSQDPTAWSFASDARIKKDIIDLPYGLATILAVKPRRFAYISDGKEDIGFVAQELQAVVPEAVVGEEIPYSDDDTPMEKATKTLGVSKDKLIPILVKAVQELKAELDSVKAELATLKA